MLLRRNICTAANSILASSGLQVTEPASVRMGSPWQQFYLLVPSLAVRPALVMHALLVNSLSLELGASQLACCSRGVCQLKGAPWVLSLLDHTRSLTLSQERNSAKSRMTGRFRLCLSADPFATCTTASPELFFFFPSVSTEPLCQKASRSGLDYER